MILDIIGIIVLILFFFRGYRRGIIVAVCSVLAILLGILVSLKLSQTFSSWLQEKGYVNSGWVTIISYVVLFIGVVLLVRMLAKLVQKATEALMLGMINRLIGGLFYVFLGAVLWSSLLWIGTRMNIISPETIAASKTYSWMSDIAPWFFDKAGMVLPFVRDTFSKLDHFFDTINNKASVGTHR